MNAEKYTQKALEAVKTAQNMAQENGNQYVTTEHLLYALLDQDGGLIGSLFGKMGVDCDGLLSELDTLIRNLPRISGGSGEVYASPEVGKILNIAEKTAEKLHDEYLSVEHLMLAIFSEGSQSVRQLLSDHGITRSRFSDELAKVKTSPVTSDNPEDSYDALKKYGTDLVERAREGKMDPVIGRDQEIRNVIRILSRKTKNNPVLIGEPGVGKTAIAEGLAQRIVRGDVPEGLKDKTIFSLDMGALVAGAKYRGEFEERLKAVLEEIRKTAPKEIAGQLDDNIHWIKEAGKNKLVVGSQARILYADSEGRTKIALAFNDAIARGEISAPVVLGRDHHDVSGTDSPYRETSNIYDGSNRTADMAVQNVIGDSFRGATWVSIHNGGGVGWGEVINGGFGMVIDGSEDSARHIKEMLLWDVNNGIARRSWARNEGAMFAIKREMERTPGLKVTLPNLADDTLVRKAIDEVK